MFDVKIIEARKGGGKARIVGGCFRNTNLGAALLLRETSREYLRPPFPHISQFPTYPILFIHPVPLFFSFFLKSHGFLHHFIHQFSPHELLHSDVGVTNYV